VANLHLIKIALGNLIENACKFTNNGKANISLNCNPPLIKILIEDNGIGISDDEAKKIFHPFYRADNTFKTKGHGIGLSLSKRILELHNGTLEVISKIGLGTTVIVTFTRVNKF
jgi:signal transduction histidine kinase